MRSLDVSDLEIENRVTGLPHVLHAFSQEQAYAVALEECQRAKGVEVRQPEDVAVPGDCGAETAHLSRDLADRSEFCASSHGVSSAVEGTIDRRTNPVP